jgi:hypothetical protein
MWDALAPELSGRQSRSGQWDADADADRRARWTRVVGSVVGVAGVVLAVLGGYLSARQTDLPLMLAGLGGALAGGGAAVAVRGWELRVFTPEGSAAWPQIESLRRFLAQPPPTAVDEVIALRRIGRYTAWAVALGESGCALRRLRANVRHPLLHVEHGFGQVERRRWWRERRRRRRRWGRQLLVRRARPGAANGVQRTPAHRTRSRVYGSSTTDGWTSKRMTGRRSRL